MSDESQTYPTKPEEKDILVRFFMAPVEVRSYTNLFYLLLSFPLGIFYFVFLLTGLSVGLGLTIVWVGLPILAMVFAASWGMAALERRLAMVMLGADVPPMTPQASGVQVDLWTTVKDFLANPVTWKGMGYLFLKFPLGIFSFVLTVTLLSISLGFILAPLAYWFGDIYIPFWEIDTMGETLILSAMGVLFLLVSMHLLNGLAMIWREIAEVMLGSRRFEVPADPGSELLTTA
ncbi:MAG TPA: sensor domain-containing protein [Thermoanaerobaculia bacterium]|nr:sensor domain-containing protein [Thermoanaerobaculia bacterium]